MCGNFGIILCGSGKPKSSGEVFNKSTSEHNDLDKSIQESMHEVEKLDGLRVQIKNNSDNLNDSGSFKMLPLLEILKGQIACTEIRGGQVGY